MIKIPKGIRPTIISRYVFRHFTGPFMVAFAFFTFIIMVFYLKEIIRLAIQKSIPFEIVGKLIFYSTGWTVALTFPMAALMAVIMAIGGMNTDSEIIALRAGGVTYPRIFRPFLWFGVFTIMVMLWYSHAVIPYCFEQMRSLSVHILKADPTLVISENQFTVIDNNENKRIIYVEKIENQGKKKSKLLKNVQIRTLDTAPNGILKVSEVILAKEGKKVQKALPQKPPQKALRLFRGYVLTGSVNASSSQRIDFRNGYLDVNLSTKDDFLGNLSEGDFGAYQTMALFEKISELENRKSTNENETDETADLLARAQIELHKRFALPFATFIFLFLGFPLGIANRRAGKGMGFGLSIAFIFIYFALFLFANTIGGAKGFLPPFLAAWLGNLVTFFIGAGVFVLRTGDYRISDIPQFFRSIFIKK